VRNLVLRVGNLVLRVGNLVLSLGNLVLSLGNLVLSLGNAVLSLGNAVLSLGNAVLSLGNAVLSLGNAVLSLGNAKLIHAIFYQHFHCIDSNSRQNYDFFRCIQAHSFSVCKYNLLLLFCYACQVRSALTVLLITNGDPQI
jgi:hypothetical protein